MSTARPELAPPDLVTDLTVVRSVDRTALVAVAAMAVATDLVGWSGPPTLAGSLFVVVVAAGLVGSGRLVNPPARLLALAAPVFGLFLAVRASAPVVLLDMGAAAGLLALAASLARGGDPLDLTLPDLARRGLVAVAHGAAGPAFLLGGGGPSLSHREDRPRAWAPAARGALLAAPLVLLLGLLLGAADPVFASWFDLSFDAGDLVVHAVLLGLGVWGGAGLLRMASSVSPAPLPAPRSRLGYVEAATVVGALVALYTAFGVSQLVTLAGGARHVLDTAGLTYAEYARSGFFQLLAAATLTLGVLLSVRAAADLDTPGRRRTFTILAEAAVALTLVIVVVAVRRLHLYEQAYGLTLARLFAVVFAVWVGAVFVLLALSLAGVHRRRRWLVPAAVGAGLLCLLALNVMGLEAVVVERNVANYQRTGRLDTGTLLGLSDDAVPALVDALPRLDPVARRVVLDRLCATPDDGAGDLPSWSLSGHRADAARRKVC
ncbi:MAG: DUF4153 domain-containing protein [Actinomycetota bacterium]